METVQLTFPDGAVKEVKKGISAADVIKEHIGEGLYRAAVAVKIDGTTCDLSTPVTTDANFTVLTFKDEEGRDVFLHSASHVLAMAVKRLFPEAKLTIGPAVEDGFYYDIDKETPFSEEDMKSIQAEMKKIVKEDIPFERLDVSVQEAKEHMADNPYKLEMIDELGDEQMTCYRNGEFVDLCRGPHVESTGRIKALKLTKLAGAYWRGDASNKQLQRIYGVAFPSKNELKDYLRMLEEAEKRNHIKLGKKFDLFSMHPEAPGSPFWHPKGMVLRRQLLDYWYDLHLRDDYVMIETPIMLSRSLWETSGHWENYRENMYTLKVDDQDFAVKPMNCPGGLLWYKETLHSYKEFPLRVAELGHVHRHEMSGTLNGLFRVRAFHQDDAHIFMTEEQIKDEILGVLSLIDKAYKVFGFEYHLELSTRPDKSIGSDEAWEMATVGLRSALDETGREYQVNEGDGAFYGPKIDVHLTDCLGRTWQCATIQLDMNLPERFDLTYEGPDGEKHRPIMIHRVVYGSIERFIGILIEHYAGKFPLWLAPEQVRILPIADRHKEFAAKVKEQMFESGLRAVIDAKALTVSKKVRNAQVDQVPYILVVGDTEMENGTVNVRTRDNEVHGEKKVDALINELVDQVQKKQ
ncbi:MAG: threonine--tRNA ligase [Nanoarchaeota archaeon]